MLGVSVGTARKLNVAPVYYTYRIPVVASFVFVVSGSTDKADYGLERSPKASLFLFGIRVCGVPLPAPSRERSGIHFLMAPVK